MKKNIVLMTCFIILAGTIGLGIWIFRDDGSEKTIEIIPSETGEQIVDLPSEDPPLNTADSSVDSPVTVGPSEQILIDKIKLQRPEFEGTFIAPSYVDKNIVAFEVDNSNERSSYISTISRDDETAYSKIYVAPGNGIINSLVGVDARLFWVEYSRKRQNNMKWEIKTMLIGSKKQVEVLRSGISKDEINPPLLRVNENRITWIESDIRNNIVYSTAIIYDVTTKKITEIAAATLDETKVRKGEFFVIQQPTSQGLLIQKSLFNGTEGDSGKSFQIALYPYDLSNPLVMSEGNGIIDFTSNSEWFAWSEVGKVSIASAASKEIKHVIKTKDETLTVDSLQLAGNKLYYRYSMFQIFELDLLSGETLEISDYRLTTSKLFRTDNFLGFSYMDAQKNDGTVEMDILEIN
ncbi:hypothetical protein [Paenibacillus sp. PL91]|uniref:hypothetical protein n=1 Tax=Paenibacillus sp. PL91 TaxID=2729538 RepID=UPI00145F55C0|nr:hypothetical protein [Paenibacillus sp. PL91]MBC9203738.1 hypothetical protein [Paenibacillus sp. PL91]